MKEMYPIETTSKAKRICFTSTVSVISWAYMKELRENNKTMVVDEINPYVEIYRFRDNLYGLFNQNCDGMGDVWVFLIIGPEKALLIDTAYGLGNLRALVDKLTGGKPLYVVNTHHHCDHAFGNCRFDRVYCHEYLVPYLKQHDAHIWDYLFDKNGNNIWLEFDRKDLPVFRSYEIIGVKDGYVFDLGDGYEVELVWTAGHTAGHAMYLDRHNRILFAGDDLCCDMCGIGSGPKSFDPYGQYSNIETFTHCLEGLVDRLDEYDYVFPSHFMVNLESRVMLDMLETCRAILKDPEDYDFIERRESPKGDAVRFRKHKMVRGFSSIAYMDNGVFAPKIND